MTPILETVVTTGMFSPKKALAAVNGVSVQLMQLAKVSWLLGLQKPTKGNILFDGQPFERLSQFERAARVQPIFQDPYSSLNPRKQFLKL